MKICVDKDTAVAISRRRTTMYGANIRHRDRGGQNNTRLQINYATSAQRDKQCLDLPIGHRTWSGRTGKPATCVGRQALAAPGK